MSKAKFIGEVRTEWLTHPGKDRDMQLMENFSFIDPKGNTWTAEAGHVINGASIPKPLWSVFPGSPYVGDYRRASVLHDYYCALPGNHTYPQVHRMFYDAMVCDGVSRATAKIMYMAVYPYGTFFKPKKKETVFASVCSIMNEDDYGPDIDELEEALATGYSALK